MYVMYDSYPSVELLMISIDNLLARGLPTEQLGSLISFLEKMNYCNDVQREHSE